MKVKKVLFHIHAMGRGGAERVVSILASALVNDGIEVTLVTLWKEKNEYEIPEKVKRITIDDKLNKTGKIEKTLGRYTVLRKVIKDEEPDIVISFCNKANFRASISMQGLKTPLIVSVRNNPDMDYRPYRLQTMIMEKKASGCVFQTEYAKEYFSKRLQDKSVIIWNPIDEKYIKADANPEWNSDNKVKRIVSVGRIARQKNHMVMFKAFETVKDEHPDAVLELYGEDFKDGSFAELKDYIEKRGLDKVVKYMGLSSHIEEDIKDAYMFVMSSDYEGMPNALMEAMALGLPVISTDCPCGGPAMLIENGVNGILTPVKDYESMAEAMKKLLDDEDNRNRMAREALKIRDKADIESIYGSWKEYIGKTINGN